MSPTQFFECLKCGHFTQFDTGSRPRCQYCACMTGIVNTDPSSPLFRFSPKRVISQVENPKSQVESVTAQARALSPALPPSRSPSR